MEEPERRDRANTEEVRKEKRGGGRDSCIEFSLPTTSKKDAFRRGNYVKRARQNVNEYIHTCTSV